MSSAELRVAWHDLDAVQDSWDALADELGAPPHARPGWFSAWHAAFGHGGLRVLAAHRDGRLVAVLPLERRWHGWSTPTNWDSPSYVVLALTPADRAAVLEAAARASRVFLKAEALHPEAASAVTDAAAAVRRPHARRVVATSPVIELVGTFDSYISARGTGVRKQLRRRRRRLEEQGDLRLEVHLHPEPDAFEDFLSVEGSSWKVREGTAIATDVASRRFYTALATWAAERGWLRISLLKLDDRVVAGDLALQAGDSVYVLKTGYDDGLRGSTPGKLLRRESVELAYTEGLRHYELLGSDAVWKQEWTSDGWERTTVMVFAAGPHGRLARMVELHGRPAVRRWRASRAQMLDTTTAS